MKADSDDRSTDPLAERSALLHDLRDELRSDHPRLTPRQVDLIAEVAVELRLTRIRFDRAPLLPGTQILLLGDEASSRGDVAKEESGTAVPSVPPLKAAS